MAESKEKKTILIAEDNPDTRKMLGEALTGLGYEVLPAVNGREAVEIAQTGEIDLILLDIHMPEMDGYESCNILKQMEKTKEIPVIFVSALFEPYNKVQAFACGAVDYMTKPIQVEELGARIGIHIALSDKIHELEKFNKIMLDREMRIVELKREVNALASELGRTVPYPEIWKE